LGRGRKKGLTYRRCKRSILAGGDSRDGKEKREKGGASEKVGVLQVFIKRERSKAEKRRGAATRCVQREVKIELDMKEVAKERRP